RSPGQAAGRSGHDAGPRHPRRGPCGALPPLRPHQGRHGRRRPHPLARAGAAPDGDGAMNLAGLALRNLRRRPVRTALSILGIALAVGCALSLIALSRSIQDSTREGMDEMGDDLAVTQRGASDIFGGFLAEDTEARVGAVAGVAQVSGELFMFAPTGRNRQVLVFAWPETSYLWKNVPLREGRAPKPSERHVVVMGDTVAEALAKKVGDEIEIMGDQFTVIGISRYKSIINRGALLLPLPDLQDASFHPDQISTVHVKVRRGISAAEVARIKQDIEKLGKLTASESSEALDNDRNFAILNAVSLAISI